MICRALLALNVKHLLNIVGRLAWLGSHEIDSEAHHTQSIFMRIYHSRIRIIVLLWQSAAEHVQIFRDSNGFEKDALINLGNIPLTRQPLICLTEAHFLMVHHVHVAPGHLMLSRMRLCLMIIHFILQNLCIIQMTKVLLRSLPEDLVID